MMRFLKRFFAFFGGSRNQRNLLPREVSSAEPITRFLFSGKLYAASARRVKRHAFAPRNGETSIFRIHDLRDDLIWLIGAEVVGAARGRVPLARADLSVGTVREAGLEVAADQATHPRHANIVGWPTERERELLAAMELARASRLVMPIRRARELS